MTSGFLGPITEIFVFALILASWIHRIISMSCPFLEASWSKAPLNFDSDLVLDPSLLDTNRGNICFSTIKSETLYSLLRIGCTDHQIQFTSILGRSAQCVQVCVRSSLTDSWKTPSIYTACARPILSFPRSKTEKYSLRKASPRTQVSVDLLTIFSLKVV